MKPGLYVFFCRPGFIHVLLMNTPTRLRKERTMNELYHAAAHEPLADIREVAVDKTLPREERIAEFVRQIKNPYHFKCGKFTVRASFSADGATLEDCLRGVLR